MGCYGKLQDQFMHLCGGGPHDNDMDFQYRQVKRPDDEDIMKAYCALTNYIPETDENDEGVEALKVLKYWRKTALPGRRSLRLQGFRIRTGNSC